MPRIALRGGPGRTLTAWLFRDGRAWTVSGFATADAAPADISLSHQPLSSRYLAELPAGADDGRPVWAEIREAGAVVAEGWVVPPAAADVRSWGGATVQVDGGTSLPVVRANGLSNTVLDNIAEAAGEAAATTIWSESAGNGQTYGRLLRDVAAVTTGVWVTDEAGRDVYRAPDGTPILRVTYEADGRPVTVERLGAP